MNEAIKLINNLNIGSDEFVVLACSYGPDSMCLLDLLCKCNLNIVVAHVNHKLRKESDKEYKELEKFCKKNELIFEGMEILDYPKGNIEEIARSKRYEFFEGILNKYKSNYLFTAHHGDDLVETILMRLSRGSSLKGYAGFKKVVYGKKYALVRPLIFYTKDDINEYNKNNNICYAIDNTNYELVHTRNKYRHNVLPSLKEINPKIHNKFIKFSETISECVDYIDNEVNNIYDKVYLNNHLDLNEFMILPTLLKREVLKKILNEIYKSNVNKISDIHIKLIFNLIESCRVNGYVNLPLNVKVTKFYNMLDFNYNYTLDSYDFIFTDKVSYDCWSIFKVDKTDIVKSNYLIRLNSRDISLPIHIRCRKNGDKISLKNNGTKSISDIFIDKKLSIDERNNYPIVTDNNDNILWIPGIKKSKFDITIDEDYDIILKCVKKGEEDEK